MNCLNCKHWSRAYDAKGLIVDQKYGSPTNGKQVQGIVVINTSMTKGWDEKKYKKIPNSNKNYGLCNFLTKELESTEIIDNRLMILDSRDCEAIVTNEFFGCTKFENI